MVRKDRSSNLLCKDPSRLDIGDSPNSFDLLLGRNNLIKAQDEIKGIEKNSERTIVVKKMMMRPCPSTSTVVVVLRTAPHTRVAQ
jgi:hypothetical protein